MYVRSTPALRETSSRSRSKNSKAVFAGVTLYDPDTNQEEEAGLKGAAYRITPLL